MYKVQGVLGSTGLKPPHSGSHTGFADDLEKTYLPCIRNMGAATEFHAEIRNTHQAHSLSVLFPEQGHCLTGHCLFIGKNLCFDFSVLSYLFIYQVFNLTDLIRCQG